MTGIGTTIGTTIGTAASKPWVRRAAFAAALLVAFLAGVLSAVVAQAATPAHVRGKVTRYHERLMHTGPDHFLLDYQILRCGPRACIVAWHDRTFTAHEPEVDFVERVGVDACYAPAVRVRCFTRQSHIVVATIPKFPGSL